jgi:hypothetical protein
MKVPKNFNGTFLAVAGGYSEELYLKFVKTNCHIVL